MVWNIFFLHTLGIMIQIDELHDFSEGYGRAQPPTSKRVSQNNLSTFFLGNTHPLTSYDFGYLGVPRFRHIATRYIIILKYLLVGNPQRDRTGSIHHDILVGFYLVGGDWNHGIWIDFPYRNGIIIPTNEAHDFSEG